jgi:glyoxylate reductase
MTQRPLVIVTRRLPDSVEAQMTARYAARLNRPDRPFSREELQAALREATVLVPTITDRLDAALLQSAGTQLKLIANFGAGIDHLDLGAARARGLTVTNTPGALTEDTADLTMALILGVPRRLAEGIKAIDSGAFRGWSPTWMMGRRLGGMRLGIVGLGRIGQAVAWRARAFGMSIHYHNRSPIPAARASELAATYWADLDEMLAHMDIVSLNCPRTPETHHLMSAPRLQRMKRGAYLVNTARGDIVDEAALAEALASGHLGGAGLDVHEHEPEVHPRLRTLPNVLLLPHLGSGTIEARTAMGEKVLANIAAFLEGAMPPDAVP